MKEKQKSSLEVFESAPVGQAVMKNTIPAMVAMMMVLGTVFGIGGTSVISRAMGEGRREYAKKYVPFVCGAVSLLVL